MASKYLVLATFLCVVTVSNACIQEWEVLYGDVAKFERIRRNCMSRRGLLTSSSAHRPAALGAHDRRDAPRFGHPHPPAGPRTDNTGAPGGGRGGRVSRLPNIPRQTVNGRANGRLPPINKMGRLLSNLRDRFERYDASQIRADARAQLAESTRGDDIAARVEGMSDQEVVRSKHFRPCYDRGGTTSYDSLSMRGEDTGGDPMKHNFCTCFAEASLGKTVGQFAPMVSQVDRQIRRWRQNPLVDNFKEYITRIMRRSAGSTPAHQPWTPFDGDAFSRFFLGGAGLDGYSAFFKPTGHVDDEYKIAEMTLNRYYGTGDRNVREFNSIMDDCSHYTAVFALPLVPDPILYQHRYDAGGAPCPLARFSVGDLEEKCQRIMAHYMDKCMNARGMSCFLGDFSNARAYSGLFDASRTHFESKENIFTVQGERAGADIIRAGGPPMGATASGY